MQRPLEPQKVLKSFPFCDAVEHMTWGRWVWWNVADLFSVPNNLWHGQLLVGDDIYMCFDEAFPHFVHNIASDKL